MILHLKHKLNAPSVNALTPEDMEILCGSTISVVSYARNKLSEHHDFLNASSYARMKKTLANHAPTVLEFHRAIKHT